jgi:hypothetical protein
MGQINAELSVCSALVCKERITEHKYPTGFSLQTTSVSKTYASLF